MEWGQRQQAAKIKKSTSEVGGQWWRRRAEWSCSWRLREVAKVVAGVAEGGWHRQVADEVVDGEAEALGARGDAGCVVDSVGAKGTRGASRKAVSSWVVGRPTERGRRVWGAGVQYRCRCKVRGAGAQHRCSRENLGECGECVVQGGAQGWKGVQGDSADSRNSRVQWVLGVRRTAQGSTVWGEGWAEAQAGDWGTG